MKSALRDALPRRVQVPFKFWYCKLRGNLEVEMALLPSLLHSSDRVIDIGANRGVYAYLFAQLASRVELFEPNPACYKILASWAAHKPHVSLHSVALSDHDGSAQLYIPVDSAGVQHDASASIENSGSGQFCQQTVTLSTLDSFRLSHVALIKIDVEGHELSVIQGARTTIISNKPALLIEIEKRHSKNPFSSIFNLLHESGYQSFFFNGKNLRPIESFDLERDQCLDNFGIKNAYINNFLFLHHDRLNNGTYDQLFQRFGQ
jgi:FkbM family methyltransferase